MTDVRSAEPVQIADRRVREFLTPRQFLAANPSVKRTKLYEDIRGNRFPHIRLSRKVLIPSDALDQLVAFPVDHDGPRAA